MSLYKVGDEVTVLSEYRPYTSSSDYWLAFPQVMLDNWGGHTAKICRVDSARRPREYTLSKDEGLYTLDGVPAQYRFSAEMFEQTYTKDQETDIISQLEELGDAMSGVESDDGESPGKIMNGNIALCSGDNYMIMHAPNSRVFNPVITYKNEDYNLNGICTTDSSKELPKRILSAALKNIPLAIEAWNKIPKTSDHPNDQFTALIAQAVAGVAADKVAESMKSKLDNFIQETYGILPKKIVIETPVQTKEITGTLHKRFQDIIKLVNRKIPVFLTGGAGSGKNHVCKQVAEALGLEFYFSNAVSQEYKLTGFIDANGHYNDTQFYQAFKNGGLFMLDEMDASVPEVLVMLNAAIANGYFDFPVGRINAHENFRVIAAGNTVGTGADIQYTGRYQLDAASLNRFALVFMDYDEDIEMALADNDKEIVEFTHEFRDACIKSHISTVVSYRQIDYFTKIKDEFSIEDALKMIYLKGIGNDDLQIIVNQIAKSSNKYSKIIKNIYG